MEKSKTALVLGCGAAAMFLVLLLIANTVGSRQEAFCEYLGDAIDAVSSEAISIVPVCQFNVGNDLMLYYNGMFYSGTEGALAIPREQSCE
jgi:hypothetical protein